LADWLVGVEGSVSGRVSFASFATQLAGSGAVYEALLGKVDLPVLTAIDTRVGTVETELSDLQALGGAVSAPSAAGGPVATATTGDVALTGAYTVDGRTMTNGEAYLAWQQAAGATVTHPDTGATNSPENGIYIYNDAGAHARRSDMDAAGDVQATSVFVTEGTANGGKTFSTYSVVATLGTDPITWVLAQDQSGLKAYVDARFDTTLQSVPIYDESGVGFGFIDSVKRRTDLEVGPNGRFTTRVISNIASALSLPASVQSGPAITCVGDSLTAGAGGGGTSFPGVLAYLTGRVMHYLGVGGETSATIVGRLGPLPFLLTPVGGEIPASGSVPVTLTGTDGGAVAPLLQGSAGINPCTWLGVDGTFSYSGGTYSFTRSTPGAAVPVPRPAPLITAAKAHRDDIMIMWWGQNDGTNDATDIIARQKAAIQWLSPLDKRWLVCGLTTSSLSYRAPMHAQFLAEFGRRFVNLHEYLASYAALAEAGITPTAQDDIDIANGVVPTSLRSDSTHLNAAGYTLVANCIYARLLEFGWV